MSLTAALSGGTRLALLRPSIPGKLARLGLRHPILPAFAVIMAVVAMVIYLVLVDSQRRIIEYQVVKVAEVVARLALAARSTYSASVVDKLRVDGFDASAESHGVPGHVPLPAQFLKSLGKQSSDASGGLFMYRPISRWNLEPTQGLTDDFLRWGWERLALQDRLRPEGPIDWQPVWRFETLAGVPTLRYLRADPAAAASCVNCHNAMEADADVQARRRLAGVEVGKKWRQHQLLGAIEVRVPVGQVEQLATSQTRQTLLTVLAISVLGLAAAGWFAIRDSRRKIQISESLERQARHDPLTGLLNRSGFSKAVDQQIELCRRSGSRCAVLFVDLDRFKTINDSLGHAAGDMALRIIAQRLRNTLRATDHVARHSGDEFTVLVSDPGDRQSIQAIGRGLQRSLAEPLAIRGQLLYMSASIGVSRFPDDGDDLDSLLKRADAAMYRAKQRGRDLVELYAPNEELPAVESLNLHRSLRLALERDEFELLFQPRVRLSDFQVTGVEALIRWRHPELGLLTPDKFLPFAEDIGLIRPIGDWALRRALAQAREWAAAGLPRIRVAVNVSPRQFFADDFASRLGEILDASGVPPNWLELEVTEGTLIHDPHRVAETFARCQKMGVVISLDDFGTGYSSLAYLKQFPIDFLKIDKSFVDGLPDDGNDQVLTRAIIGLAHSLGLQVVAEGVEDAGQLAFLQAHGCEEVQGYLFARPLPPSQVEVMLRAGRLDPAPGNPAAPADPAAVARPAPDLQH